MTPTPPPPKKKYWKRQRNWNNRNIVKQDAFPQINRKTIFRQKETGNGWVLLIGKLMEEKCHGKREREKKYKTNVISFWSNQSYGRRVFGFLKIFPSHLNGEKKKKPCSPSPLDGIISNLKWRAGQDSFCHVEFVFHSGKFPIRKLNTVPIFESATRGLKRRRRFPKTPALEDRKEVTESRSCRQRERGWFFNGNSESREKRAIGRERKRASAVGRFVMIREANGTRIRASENSVGVWRLIMEAIPRFSKIFFVFTFFAAIVKTDFMGKLITFLIYCVR